MRIIKRIVLASFVIAMFSCRTMVLSNKTIQINQGDPKSRVMEVMGTPEDRQFMGKYEIWQYCITGAGFGYHDYRAIWMVGGKVIGITSYKDRTPGSGCEGHFKPLKVEDAPDYILEVRQR